MNVHRGVGFYIRCSTYIIVTPYHASSFSRPSLQFYQCWACIQLEKISKCNFERHNISMLSSLISSWSNNLMPLVLPKHSANSTFFSQLLGVDGQKPNAHSRNSINVSISVHTIFASSLKAQCPILATYGESINTHYVVTCVFSFELLFFFAHLLF